MGFSITRCRSTGIGDLPDCEERVVFFFWFFGTFLPCLLMALCEGV
jgi:hypothetical protein